MAIDEALVDLMTETVTQTPPSGYSGTGYSIPTSGTPVTHKAFVQRERRTVRNDEGEVESVDITVWTDSILDDVTPADRFTYNANTYRPVQVNIYRDETGPHHSELHLAKVVVPT